MPYLISGIQQVGIGVSNVQQAFSWYNKHFGMDIEVFEEAANANLMLRYTGGKAQSRHAILALNLKGGSGLEIWQYTSRVPQPSAFQIQLGDLGLFCAKIKSDNIQTSYNYFKSQNINILGQISLSPLNKKHFFVRDPFNNIFEVIEDENWFSTGTKSTGGPNGMMIGVSNIEASVKFYSEILGYNKILYKGVNSYDDLKVLPGGSINCTRIILTHSDERQGPFSKLLGNSYIELIEAKNYTPRKIFENRFWGDLGFIHLCFDIKDMESLKSKCAAKGHSFTIDGGSGFEMGAAAGHFSYIEDPDGTLIEFVETKKVPILKKWGWYLDLRKRAQDKRLPDWMIKTLKFNRKKVL